MNIGWAGKLEFGNRLIWFDKLAFPNGFSSGIVGEDPVGTAWRGWEVCGR